MPQGWDPPDVTNIVAFEIPDEEADGQLIDVLVRVLLADGLGARRTGADRFEVAADAESEMEWCSVGEMLFGRALADVGERAWCHTVPGGRDAAPSEVGRRVSRIVRGLADSSAGATMGSWQVLSGGHDETAPIRGGR
ncbi:MAG TPA: hypothetical protein VIN56_00165 [Candidatus Dormibacteraeota bacterium]|jgi:hypothetical protein